MTGIDHDALALPTAHRLEGYEIMRVLGYGGFGITYLAQDLDTGDRVAIKEYLPTDLAVRLEDGTVAPKTAEDKEVFDWGLDRFVNEARTLARFSHPNIVGVQRFLQVNATAYMVMDYQHGVPFGQILDEHGDLDESEILEILPPLLDGLAAVHEAGVLHRDIKPDNIFIRNDGSPVLLDFGAARIEVGKQSQSLHRVFTPGYAAPEQYESGDGQGPWTDVYGMAAVLYSAISGRAPLEAPARTGALVRTQKDALEPAQQVGHGRFKPHFLTAIDWGLNLDPAQRPQDVGAWRDALMGQGAAIDQPAADGAAVAQAAEAVDRQPALAAETAGAVPPADGREIAGGESGIAQSGLGESEDTEISTLVAGRPTGGTPKHAPAKQKTRSRGPRLALVLGSVFALMAAGGVLGWQLFKRQSVPAATAADQAARESGQRDDARKAQPDQRDTGKAETDRKPADRTADPATTGQGRLWRVGPAPDQDSPDLAHALVNAPDKARIQLNMQRIPGGFSIKRGLILIGTGEGDKRTTFLCFDEPCLTFNGDGAIMNLRVVRRRRGFEGPAIRVNEGKVTIAKSTISSQGDVGIDVAGGSLLLFQSRIFRNGRHGIIIRPSARDVTIIGSEIHGNRRSGVIINARTSTRLKSNRVFENRRHGVMVLGRSKAVLEDNFVSQNGGVGIHVGRDAGIVDRDNKITKNYLGRILRQ